MQKNKAIIVKMFVTEWKIIQLIFNMKSKVEQDKLTPFVALLFRDVVLEMWFLL